MNNQFHHLREVQIRLSGLHDGLEAKADDLQSPFIDLLVDELKNASLAIDSALSQLEPDSWELSGSMVVDDYGEIMTDGM